MSRMGGRQDIGMVRAATEVGTGSGTGVGKRGWLLSWGAVVRDQETLLRGGARVLKRK